MPPFGMPPFGGPYVVFAYDGGTTWLWNGFAIGCAARWMGGVGCEAGR
jgi:hypothetical protein